MSKNLVICPVGQQSTHRLWNMGEKNFDTVLICYDYKAFRTFRNDDGTVFYRKGYKYPMIKEYLAETGLQYDNYLFIDDDTGISAADINQCFELMDKTGIKVLHPAVESKNQPNIIINPNPDTEYRFSTWTEIQCWFMSKDYLRQVIDNFDLNISGWGLPDVLYAKTQIPYCIYDLVTVLHCRATNTGVNPLYKDVQTAYNEFEKAVENIELEHKILSFKLRNLISFPIIFSKEKASYLDDCIKSLPPDSEIVLVETEQDENIEEGLWHIQKNGNHIFAKYIYKEWDYSKARNAAKSLCTRPIIFSIDSDERLLTHQHTSIIKAAIDLYKSDFAGLQIRNISNCPTFAAENTYYSTTIEQVKIFKNLQVLQWRGKIHETIDLDIVEKGFKYADSNIIIHHIGYEAGIDELIEKSKGRLLGLISMDEPKKYDKYFNDVIQESININNLQNIKKKGT